VAGGEQFGHDFFSFDGEEAEFVAMFFVAEGAESGDFGLREHGHSRYNSPPNAKLQHGSFFIALDRGIATVHLMKSKALFRGIVVLALVFVALYVGMSNQQPIQFSFPLLLKQKITQPAAILFYALFAIGVITGVLLVPPPKSEKDESGPAKRKK
jgi:hypothetical protein